MTTRNSKPVQGALLLALSALLFSLMGVLIREVSSTAGNEAVVFFRNLIGVLAFLPLVLLKGVAPLSTQRLKSHLWRSGFGLLAMYCFFYAIAHLPLADAMVFTYSAPVFTPLIAWWWLKEPLTRRMQLTSLVGFAGVLLVAKPSGALFDSLSLVGLAASILAAFAFVSIREMSDTEPAFRMVFYFALFSTLGSTVPFVLTWQPLSNSTLLLLVAVGVMATISQLAMSKAYTLAPPGLIGPFAYLAIVFSGLLAWLRWGETPDLWSIIGTLLIFGASLSAVIRRKR